MERNYLKKYDIKIVIISRGRSKTIRDRTCTLLPNYIEVVVPDTQKELYSKEIPNPLIAIPESVKGLGKLRNYILDMFNNKTVIMLDDDLKCCYSLTGELSRKVEDKKEILQLLINTAVMAQDMGVSMFGFNQTDIRKYSGTEPFTLNTWVGGIVGINGRNFRFRDDEFKVDIDYTLQCLLVDRITLTDNRYTFAQERENNKGGNSEFRNEEKLKTSIKTLEEKWQNYIKVKKIYKGNYRTNINVKRRQLLVYD